MSCPICKFFKKEEAVLKDPYRTASPPEDAQPSQPVEPIKPVKKKREFKMPEFKIHKHVKTFIYVLLLAASIIGIGIMYDLRFPGTGTRVGIGIAFGLVGLFFGIMSAHNATDGFKE